MLARPLRGRTRAGYEVGAQHILLGLAWANALLEYGVTQERLGEEVRRVLTDHTRQRLEAANVPDSNQIGVFGKRLTSESEHILLGLLRHSSCPAARGARLVWPHAGPRSASDPRRCAGRRRSGRFSNRTHPAQRARA